jgi:hypothetical protein
MLIEGIYLNILLTYSIFDDNKHKLMVFFYFLGWGSLPNKLRQKILFLIDV